MSGGLDVWAYAMKTIEYPYTPSIKYVKHSVWQLDMKPNAWAHYWSLGLLEPIEKTHKIMVQPILGVRWACSHYRESTYVRPERSSYKMARDSVRHPRNWTRMRLSLTWLMITCPRPKKIRPVRHSNSCIIQPNWTNLLYC